MPTRHIFDLINKAIDGNDAELIQQLTELLERYGQEVQAEGNNREQ